MNELWMIHIEKSALFCLARGFVYVFAKWNRSEIIRIFHRSEGRGDSVIWLLSSPRSLEAINRSRQFCNDPGLHEMVDSVPSGSNCRIEADFRPIRKSWQGRPSCSLGRQLGWCIPSSCLEIEEANDTERTWHCLVGRDELRGEEG